MMWSGSNSFTKAPSRSNAVRTRCSVSLLAGPRYIRGVWDAQTIATDMIGFLWTRERLSMVIRGLFVNQRALALGEWPVNGLAGQRLQDVVEVPITLVLSKLLHLEQIHVVD